jgi:hypothetical protein
MRHSYNDETKAAVMASLLSGQSVGQVAREYNIPKGTVSGWKKGAVPNNATQKKDIGLLLLAYLETNLNTLRMQAIHFSDEKWLFKQNAADLAVLHGVMTDKAIRLLEAMSNANGNKD